MPDAPVVIPESGSYEIPTMIEVKIPEDGTVYYTTDRSDPNVDSMKYVEPISMPLGRSNYKFIVISDDGVQSEIVSRSYNFSMNTSVTVDRAVSNVIVKQWFTEEYNRRNVHTGTLWESACWHKCTKQEEVKTSSCFFV